MTILVTGSAGHLGVALMRHLRANPDAWGEARGIDLLASPFTDRTGSIADRAFVRESMRGVRTVLHAATLHKPHVATHAKRDFVETNIAGTLALLEEAVAAGVQAYVFTSTTSSFGSALTSRFADRMGNLAPWMNWPRMAGPSSNSWLPMAMA